MASLSYGNGGRATAQHNEAKERASPSAVAIEKSPTHRWLTLSYTLLGLFCILFHFSGQLWGELDADFPTLGKWWVAENTSSKMEKRRKGESAHSS